MNCLFTKKIFFTLFFLLFSTPLLLSANTLGFSPATIEMEIEKGETIEKKINLSRLNVETQYDFRVSYEEETDLIKVKDPENVFIPVGETNKYFIIEIDTNNFELGEYNNIAYFSLQPTEVVSSANAVEFRLGCKIKINIVEPGSLVKNENINTASSDENNDIKTNNSFDYKKIAVMLFLGLIFIIIIFLIFKNKKKNKKSVNN